MDISQLIRRRRRQLGLTQQQLSDRLQISRPAVDAWENGRRSPSRSALRGLARELQLTPEEIGSGLLHDEEAAA